MREQVGELTKKTHPHTRPNERTLALMREQVGELTKKTAEQAETIARLVDLPAEIDRLRVVAATAEAAAHEAVEKRTQAEADVLDQLDTSKALLERLLKEQKER